MSSVKNKNAVVPSVPLYNHPGIEEAKEIYIINEKSIPMVEMFFKNTYNAVYPRAELESYFSYLDPSITKYDIEKKRTIRDIETKCFEIERNTPKYINMQQQMLIDCISQIYYKVSQDKEITNVNDYIRLKKSMNEDIKTFRENYLSQLQIIGMGTDPEQIKSDIEAQFAAMIGKATSALDNYPEAQAELTKTLSAMFNPNQPQSD